MYRSRTRDTQRPEVRPSGDTLYCLLRAQNYSRDKMKTHATFPSRRPFRSETPIQETSNAYWGIYERRCPLHELHVFHPRAFLGVNMRRGAIDAGMDTFSKFAPAHCVSRCPVRLVGQCAPRKKLIEPLDLHPCHTPRC